MSTACPHCPRLKSSAICSKWSVCDSPVARKLFRRSVQTLGHQAKGGTVESVDLPFFSPPWAPSGYRWTTDFQRMTATWAAVGWVGWLGITRLNQEAVMDSAIWPISRLMPWTKESALRRNDISKVFKPQTKVFIKHHISIMECLNTVRRNSIYQSKTFKPRTQWGRHALGQPWLHVLLSHVSHAQNPCPFLALVAF